MRRARVRDTKKPEKKYPFPVPIPPCSVVRRVKAGPASEDIGRAFRIGYYGKNDGLDCIWLVDEHGKYEQTVDHEFLCKYFLIELISKERSLYGRGRPQFGPLES